MRAGIINYLLIKTLKKRALLIFSLVLFCLVSYIQVSGLTERPLVVKDSAERLVNQFSNNNNPSTFPLDLINFAFAPYFKPNNTPVISSVTKSALRNQPLAFTQKDFTSGYVDADNQSLSAIRIESLPLHGRIVLAGIDVKQGQVILLEDLNKLEFTPNRDFSGNTFFRWVASNGKEYSTSSGLFLIVVTFQEVFIPEGFSPNGDGINDFFVIKGADRYNVTLKIFDRWGRKVFESTNYINNWDGTANVGYLAASKLPEGTYFYAVSFNNGEKEQVGYLTLIR